jgi:hypothetical protein
VRENHSAKELDMPKRYKPEQIVTLLARETHELWRRCGRQEESVSIAGVWRTYYWFDG